MTWVEPPVGNSLCTFFLCPVSKWGAGEADPSASFWYTGSTYGFSAQRHLGSPLQTLLSSTKASKTASSMVHPEPVCSCGQETTHKRREGSRTRRRPWHLDENWWHARWHFDVAQRIAQPFPYIFSSIRTQLNCWSLRITEPFTCRCTWSKPVSRYKLNVTVSCTRVNLNSFWE